MLVPTEHHVYTEKKDEWKMEDLSELFILSDFLNKSIVSSEYEPNDLFGEAINLTEHGEQIAKRIRKENDIIEKNIKLGMFRVFYDGEFLIDCNRTDIKKLKMAFSQEIIEGKIKYPWTFERQLYDRFFELFSKRSSVLSFDETELLLKDTNKGVFQLGKIIVGPFGMIDSIETRSFSVVLSAPLWHCNNLACNSLHFVKLTSNIHKTKFGEVSKLIENNYKMPKGLEKLLKENISNVKMYEDINPVELPLVLVNSLSESELKLLLERLIDKHSYFREQVSNIKQFKNRFSGSAQQISKKTSHSECFQLILLFSNDDIITTLEELIDDNHIVIPPTEIRESYFGYKRGSALDIKCQISHLGLRFISRRRDLALIRLRNLINDIYKEKDDLEWKLRLGVGQNLVEKFESVLMNEDPRNIVKEFLLDNPRHLKETFNYLWISNFKIPSNPMEEERLINKILWKLGFNINLYPDYLKKFWERLHSFREASNVNHIYTEADKERIRSYGVNLFVSVEEIFDASLSFFTWVLLSDHYASTKFKFNLNQSRIYMAKELSGKRVTDTGSIQFDSKGKNTLYPLVQGFSILADLCEELVQKRDDYKRSESDLPTYMNQTNLFIFPFLHEKFVLDIPKDIYNEIIALLREVTIVFEKNKVASVRNRVEHKRVDFPTKEEINVACDALEQIISSLEDKGIVPMVYHSNGEFSDSFGRGYNLFKNYKDNEMMINQSSQYSLCKLPKGKVPLVMVPILKLKNSNEFVRFKYEETSEFVEMYSNYPKRLQFNE
ncbi:hypothetical protein OB969_14250 [Bacillus cereus]|uniref:hypothetical protein n=1 Tax=Bacillus cereus group TaxID=86661 RepID=UPI000BEBFFCC|nr:hypothetical protein [Bacillus thuringiensis]MCU4845319.1 hypothetical protein [Bacillus cereus]MCU5051785.1 hypothetical protein [Bacillus cereus]MCU5064296.1 hypothetical protein [Bacillus cereus]MCU5191738.1 hypothetical protein [Bacillus cereus]MED3055992.1 hypothetical protein [Bacillus thuringiensis]